MANIKTQLEINRAVSEVFKELIDPNRQKDFFANYFDVELISGAKDPEVDGEYSFVMTRFGVGQTVRFRIEDLKPQKLVVLRQIEGVFKKWVHTMVFETLEDERCRVTEIVDYELPMGILGHFLNDIFIRRDMQKILQQRLELLESTQTSAN